MNLLLRGAACAPLLALLAGCCANSANDCDDLLADSLYFTLRSVPNPNVPGDMSYFTDAELDTVYLQRYAPARPAKPATATTPATPAQPAGALSDPQAIIRAKQTKATLNSAVVRKLDGANLPYTTLIISNNSPFSPSTTGGKLSAYNYVLTVQDRSVKNQKRYLFDISNIQLTGQYYADGCTTCYENTGKRFQVNGGKLSPDPVVTETSGQPIVTVLSKNEAN
ncbi:hypothetical protein [Hymenobacter cheonanensis]|uniref:hypothetical protein n=1 Tax=Hymenobacter sp. CA2-7 TaxID=3063993 RepID=UPI002713255A|nr:hypothetical protein [Hymenobacter sp. CA2-7]MDO7887086.1 hypothetical protein [Hymenobacter sp. CA2-7]